MGPVGVEFFAFIFVNVGIDIIPRISVVPGIHWVSMTSLGRGPITCAILISRGAFGAPICGALVDIVVMLSKRGGIGMVIGWSISLAPT